MINKILTSVGIALVCFGFTAICYETEASTLPQIIGTAALILGLAIFRKTEEERD